jgi:hypothetical protein
MMVPPTNGSDEESVTAIPTEISSGDDAADGFTQIDEDAGKVQRRKRPTRLTVWRASRSAKARARSSPPVDRDMLPTLSRCQTVRRFRDGRRESRSSLGDWPASGSFPHLPGGMPRQWARNGVFLWRSIRGFRQRLKLPPISSLGLKGDSPIVSVGRQRLATIQI